MAIQSITSAQVRVSQNSKKSNTEEESAAKSEADAVKVSLTRAKAEEAGDEKKKIEIDSLKKDVAPAYQESDPNSDAGKQVKRDANAVRLQERREEQKAIVAEEQSRIQHREYKQDLRRQDKEADQKTAERLEALSVKA